MFVASIMQIQLSKLDADVVLTSIRIDNKLCSIIINIPLTVDKTLQQLVILCTHYLELQFIHNQTPVIFY